MKTRTLAFVIASLASAALFAGEYDDLTVPSKAGVNEITGSSYYSSCSPAQAFSGNTGGSGRFLSNVNNKPWFIQYRFIDGSTPIVTNYSFKAETGSSDGPKRIPVTWTFKGSNTGAAGDWVTLDEQTNFDWGTGSGRKYFPFVNTASYTYYRFDITEKNVPSETYMGMAEIEFYGINPGPDSLMITGEPFECGSVEPSYRLVYGLTEESDPISCSASTETMMYGEDRKVTLKGWKLYSFDWEKKDYVLRDESSGNELEYVHDGKKNKLVWQFDVQCKVSIGAAEHGSASFDKEFTRSDKYATLTATADNGYGFAYWTGDVPDTDKYDNPLLLRMDVPKSVTPVFLPAKTVTPGGEETPQQAINSLGADGGVLFMDEGTYTYAATAPALYLTTPVVVRGAGRDKTVIDGQGGKMRAVTIDNANAAVVGVNVTNCVGGTSQGGDSMGSGLFITANGGRFMDGAVIGCRNSSCNGAIAMKGGRVSRSIVRANTSKIGGGIYMDNTSVPIVDNCLIADNVANDQGGAIYFCGGTLLNCTIVNNRETASGQYGGGGGVCLMSGSARTVYNCIFQGNKATKTGNGAPDWFATSTAQGQTVDFRNNAMENDLFKSQNKLPGVTFLADTDWVPSSASATKDAGAVHSKQSSRDLIGKLRVSGDAIDAGCYEFDDNVVGCSFAADPALISTNGVATLKAKVSGVEDESDLTFEWTVSNKTTDVVSSATGKNADLVEPAEGWYAVTLRVLRGSEEVANYFDGECLRVVPNEIVLSDGDDLSAAVARADLGTLIVLGDGTYEIGETIAMDRAMSIVSKSESYSSVTVAVTSAKIAFHLNNRQALLEGVTILGPVKMTDDGGTISKCRVTGCYGNRGQEMPVYAYSFDNAGFITHCVIDGNGVKPDGTVSRNSKGAMQLSDYVQVDNCLVCGNYSVGPAVYIANFPKLLNCTIVDNNSTDISGIQMYSSGAYAIKNCIVANNVGTDNNQGQPNFYFVGFSSFESRAKTSVVNCHAGLAAPRDQELFTGEVYGITDFNNPSEGDYRLGLRSCCRDAGVSIGAELMAGTDLDGNPRVSGEGTDIDLGCYESDASQVGFSFGVSPAVATTASNVVFSATVIGGKVTDYAFSWRVTNERTDEVWSGDGAQLQLANLTEGSYTVTMSVTKDGEPLEPVTIDDCLKVVPVRIDLADGDDLAAACARADEGTEIVLGAGTYPLGKMQTFKSGVTVRSASGRYADTIVTVTNAVIAFKLDHARARVQNITVKGPVLIEVNGGTLSGCRVTGCYNSRGQNVPVYAKAGSVTHCMIDRNGLAPSGAISRNTVGGVVISESAGMDNCLIANNYGGDDNYNRKGAVTVTVDAKVWNCTIAGNDNAGVGGLFCYSSVAYDIRNCVVAGNTSTSTAAGQPNLYCTQSGGFADSAREHIVNCHFGLETERASVMTKYEVYGVTRFKSPDTGNFRLKQDSCCRDVGVKMSAAFEAGTDLDGCPRVFTGDKHPIIDLGCYEAHPGGLTIFVW